MTQQTPSDAPTQQEPCEKFGLQEEIVVRSAVVPVIVMLLGSIIAAGCDGAKPAPVGPNSPVKDSQPPPEQEFTLKVTSVPAGAAVEIDGASRGLTPAEVPGLRPGTYRVRLVLDGYRGYEEEIEVTPTGVSPLEVTLEMEMSYLSIDSEPQGATAFVDGEEKGVTPLELEGMPAGAHEVRLTLRGFSDASEMVDLPPGKGAEAKTTLAVDPRRRAILEDVEDAESLLEGGRGYFAWKALEAAQAMPGRDKVLTGEDERRIGFLQGRIVAALPEVRLEVTFEGAQAALADTLGPPTGIATVVAAKGKEFLDYRLKIEPSAKTSLHVCLLQFKRGKKSIVQVVPHEVTSTEKTLLLEPGGGGTGAYESVDSTRAAADDILYCLFTSAAPLPEEGLRTLADGVQARAQGKDGLEWARDLSGLLESTPWFREGNVVLRTIVVKIGEA